jgi:hypothetical protein
MCWENSDRASAAGDYCSTPRGTSILCWATRYAHRKILRELEVPTEWIKMDPAGREFERLNMEVSARDTIRLLQVLERHY